MTTNALTNAYLAARAEQRVIESELRQITWRKYHLERAISALENLTGISRERIAAALERGKQGEVVSPRPE